MKREFRIATLVAIAIKVSACKSNMTGAPSATDNGRLTHVVLCWLKTPGDEAARKKLIEVSNSFRIIPGVIDVAAGTSLPSTRPVVDSSFDVAVVITFTDEVAMQAYEISPQHQAAVRDTLKPLVAKQVVYDFVRR